MDLLVGLLQVEVQDKTDKMKNSKVLKSLCIVEGSLVFPKKIKWDYYMT